MVLRRLLFPLLLGVPPAAHAWVATKQREQTPLACCRCAMIAPQQLGSFETLSVTSSPSKRRVLLKDWTRNEESIDFHKAWDVQKQLLHAQIDRFRKSNPESSSSSFVNQNTAADNSSVIGVDTVILLEHNPVYTLGTGSDEAFVRQQQNDGAVSVPVVRMDRGGEVTYHGRGQLTVYPVLDLRSYRQDIHWYVRALEEVAITALAECGVEQAVREAQVTGVWVENRKIAAVGVSCKKWITQHGFAINVTHESLENFKGIVPCGLEGRKVGCVNQFLPDGEGITVQQMATYVKSAMEEVFQIQLVRSDDN